MLNARSHFSLQAVLGAVMLVSIFLSVLPVQSTVAQATPAAETIPTSTDPQPGSLEEQLANTYAPVAYMRTQKYPCA